MFSFDRFNLSRFSLGSQDNTIHIELLLAENLESVAGVAIPVETTAFFNDILRGTAARSALLRPLNRTQQ